MPISKNKHNCSGCTACASICPQKCIIMKPDVLGFKYPEVNMDICTHCELCVRTCPFNDGYATPFNLESPIVYVGKSKDGNDVLHSQSGAAFAVLSDWILEQGGVVYGIGFADHFRAIHKRAVTKKERDEFRGSKYVQSDMGNIFTEVKNDLKNGLKVMFTGTPCQVAGLSSYIPNKLKNNLFLVDLVCHGVPGPKIWDDYLIYLERKNKAKIVNVNFRDKSLKGWRSHVESFKYEGKEKTYTYTYTYMFYTHINLRYSCANCPFTNMRRVGDISISDAWGIENSPSAQLGADNKGCSLFIVNTQKGNKWFNVISEKLDYRKEDINNGLRQPNLCSPSKLHPQRALYEDDYAKYGIDYVINKYGHETVIKKIKNKIAKMIPSKIRKNIKLLIKTISQ